MNRRTFLSSTGVVVLAAGPARAAGKPPLLRGGQFSEGILSGDPTPTGITLATRLVGVEGAGQITLEIARDAGFDRIVTRSRLQTSDGLGHAIKARVNGLKPHTRYWYRFAGRTAESPVGRFRTALPADSHQFVQFGVITGLDYTSGFFNAAELLADEDLDFVLNLGSYIHADRATAPPEGVRSVSDAESARSLSAYRKRYRAYRRDVGLRRMHAAHPLISTWDDGEVESDYAGADVSAALKRSAYRAWFEAMPHYPKQTGQSRVYFRPQFGRTLDLFVCDTRQYRRAAPSDSLVGLLGSAQSRFLRTGLKTSGASWRLVATPAPVADLGDGADGWAGYQTEREELLSTIDVHEISELAFLAGSRRRFVAANVADAQGKQIAPEFSCGSATRRTDAETGDASPSDAATAVENDGSHHGYAVVSVASDLCTVRFSKLSTVRSRAIGTDPLSVYELAKGERTLEEHD